MQGRHIQKFLFFLLLISSKLTAQRSIPADYSTSVGKNYIRTWDATAPEQSVASLLARPLSDVKQVTQYYDGLGRPFQTVIKQGSLEGSSAKDFVTAVEYDQLGREQFRYNPFASSTNEGNFKPDAFQQQATFMQSQFGGQGETYFYGRTKFEASPLGRPEEQYAAGNSWAGSADNANPSLRRGVKMKYWLNTSVDDVKKWSVTNVSNNFGTYSVTGVYAAGELYKNVTEDENGKQTIEFKDKEGNIILKKVQLTASVDDGTGRDYTNWLCTYYIYDDLNNLRCVIQPEGVKTMANPANNWDLNYSSGVLMNEQCFRYEYDERKRMIMKKVPGADLLYMVYDAKDRLVMTQDANLRNGSPAKWLVTKYDGLNRPVLTALIESPASWQTHQSNANGSTEYPVLSNFTNEVLAETFYDNYNWLSGYSTPFSANYYTGVNNLFYTNYNVYPYPQPLSQTSVTKGLVTGTRTKVIGTSQYLYSITYYDERGRILQTSSTNVTGCDNSVTNQYSFSGLLVASYQFSGNCTVNLGIGIMNKYEYDDLGRLVTQKKTVYSNGPATSEKAVVQNGYNAMGQLKRKRFSPDPNNSGNQLEKLDYDYNIRGWLLGANRDYVKSTSSTSNYFGFDLGYDKTTIGTLGSYTQGAYNGNITGMLWKSTGDDAIRKYDFAYDALNRLTGADFNQYTSGFNKNEGIDYSVSALSYDGNGNIISMNQKGWKIGGSGFIDQMSYSYMPNSNKLLSVTDAANDNSSKLGDFKYDALAKTATDYNYDANGNLISDNNKKISSIIYNYLNLPGVITVTGKGTISYVYDATGNKLKKVVAETGQQVKTTLYLPFGTYENDVLQFLPMEEGRIRPLRDAGNNIVSFTFDYFIRDHLGNVRMVLTDEQKTDAYPVASMETATTSIEEGLYSNLPETRTNKPAGYPNDTYTNPNDKVSKVRGDGQKIGPGIVLKVMAGDKFNLRVNSWYKLNGGSPQSPNPLNELASALANNIASVAGGKATSSDLTSNGLSTSAANSFLGMQNYNLASGKPKAYVCWVLLDEQFKVAGDINGNIIANGYSGFDPVGGDEEFKTHLFSDMPINKSGYLYIYVSNETPNIDVFFDNLQVTHIRGPILEETHYYPFGLTMNGISSKALNNHPPNSYKFNEGSELHNREFSDGSGLEMYETAFRGYDPQVGRFWQADPLAEATDSWSPYAYCNNNPILFNDPLGLDTTVVINGQKITFTDKEWASNVTVTGHKPRQQQQQSEARINPLPVIPEVSPVNAPKTPPEIDIPKIGPEVPLIGTATLLRGGLLAAALLAPLKAGYAMPGCTCDGYAVCPHNNPLHPDYAPYPGHGNNRENWNPHAVYSFTFTPNDNSTPVIKFGIYDIVKDPNRAVDQKAMFQAIFGASVTLKILTRTMNREQALTIEQTLVNGHFQIWRRMPRAQTLPSPK